MRTEKVFRSGVIGIGLGVLTLFLYWRLRLGLVRYFDIDEFAHLHWAHNAFSGQKPYVDFLYFFPPGFLIALWPVFALVPKTAAVFAAARIVAWVFFLMLALAVFLTVMRARNLQTALATSIVLAFLPLPYDKFLEIRPDTLAAAGAFWSLFFLIIGICHREEKKWLSSAVFLFASGIILSSGIVVLPKVVFFLPATCLTVAALRKRIQAAGAYGLGLALPIVATIGYYLRTGNLAQATYLTTVFSSQSARVLGQKFPMLPNLFFYPNDTYYAEGGISFPLVLNLCIYLVGIGWGIISFVSFLDKKKQKEIRIELLLSLAFLSNLFAFIFVFPLKHAQYLIPIAPFIAFYFSDALVRLPQTPAWARGMRIAGFLLLYGAIVWKGYGMYLTKKQWTNERTLQEFSAIQKSVPQSAYVLDLVGQTVFYKDPYYVCCVPWGQYTEAFGFTLPSLKQAMEEKDDVYVFAHNADRIGVLPPADAEYIRTHFEPLVQYPLLLQKKRK